MYRENWKLYDGPVFSKVMHYIVEQFLQKWSITCWGHYCVILNFRRGQAGKRSAYIIGCCLVSHYDWNQHCNSCTSPWVSTNSKWLFTVTRVFGLDKKNFPLVKMKLFRACCLELRTTVVSVSYIACTFAAPNPNESIIGFVVFLLFSFSRYVCVQTKKTSKPTSTKH